MTAPLISLRGVERVFDTATLAGIRDVSFDIYAGEFVAIVGPSGAGKSTLLNILGVLDRADSGEYRFAGVNVATLPEKGRDRLRSRAIGYVFQSAFVLNEEDALRNAALGLRIQGVPLAARAERAAIALRSLSMMHRYSTAAKLLSGGERQRVAVARALATRPLVVLADEPTGNLDSATGSALIADLRRINAEGTTIVIVTHDSAIAEQADRRLSVLDGRVIDSASRDLADVPSTEAPGGRAGATSGPDTASLTQRRVAGVGRLFDDVGDAVSALSHQLRRSVLLSLVFALGVGGLVAATGISSSASAQVEHRLAQSSLNQVRVTAPGGAGLFKAGDNRLRNWVAALEKLPHVRQVVYSATVAASSAPVRRLAQTEPPPDEELLVMSASQGYVAMLGGQVLDDHSLPLLDDPQVSGVFYVGKGAAAQLGLPAPGAGASLWVNGRRLSLIGEIVPSAAHPELDRTLLVSRDVVAGMASVGVTIIVRTDNGYPATVAAAVPLVLDPSNPGSFRVETVADLRSLRKQVSGDLASLVGVLSGVLLLIAVLSAATTLFLSVRARTQEIALRRALGTSRGGIARLFLLEGLLVGALGGAVGACVGIIAMIATSHTQGWVLVAPVGLTPFALALGAITGIVSAVVPSWAASRQQPASAIRG